METATSMLQLGNFPVDKANYDEIKDYHQGKGTGGEEPWVWLTTTPQGTEMKSGFTRANDPYESGRDHRVYEFQIPCRFLGQGYVYGLYAFVWDEGSDTLLEWPVNAGGTKPYSGGYDWTPEYKYKAPPAPGNWGDVTSNVEFVPEFPSFFVLPLLMTAGFLSAIVYRRKSKSHQIA